MAEGNSLCANGGSCILVAPPDQHMCDCLYNYTGDNCTGKVICYEQFKSCITGIFQTYVHWTVKYFGYTTMCNGIMYSQNVF